MAFQELHRRRQWSVGGMGGAIPQPISLSETLTYARFLGLDGTIALRVIGAMDEEYRAHYGQSTEDEGDAD